MEIFIGNARSKSHNVQCVTSLQLCDAVMSLSEKLCAIPIECKGGLITLFLLLFSLSLRRFTKQISLLLNCLNKGRDDNALRQLAHCMLVPQV